MADKVPRCDCTKRGICKPDVIFFGEDLPLRFYSLQRRDFQTCDLLLIMGTSLEVEPFASLVNAVHYNVPRVLFNRDRVGPFSGRRARPWDIACLGDLTESVQKLVDLIGWSADLESVMKDAMERSKWQ
jgi:NAD-dependent deacetylase sirtuin 3